MFKFLDKIKIYFCCKSECVYNDEESKFKKGSIIPKKT